MDIPLVRPVVSMIVLTRNNPLELSATLSSIRGQRVSADLQVLVVDGNDVPIQPEAVTPFELIRDHPARGIYPAMNLGLARSCGQYVQFLNAGDSWLHPQALQRLLDYAQAHRKRTGTVPRVVFGQAQICAVPPSRCPPWLVPDPEMRNLKRWLWFYLPNHQSMLVDGDWARLHPYKLDSPQAACRSWMTSALADLNLVAYLSEPVVAYNLGGVSSQLPTWPVLYLRLREPSRSMCAKAAETVKLCLRPIAHFYPHLMAFRSRIIGWLTQR